MAVRDGQERRQLAAQLWCSNAGVDAQAARLIVQIPGKFGLLQENAYHEVARSQRYPEGIAGLQEKELYPGLP
jgi:hypothetical protein